MRRLFNWGVSASVFFFAVSAAVQAPGLWGEQGLSPFQWPQAIFNAGTYVTALCGFIAMLALLSFHSRLRTKAWILIFPLTLILMNGGGPFLFFQWDVLLLEVLVLAALLEISGRDTRWPILAGRAALFKLMFLSGVVKLQSGDPTWIGLTALDFHFWTQPLPTPLGLWVAEFPSLLKTAMTAATLALEIGGGFLLFTGRRSRRAVAYAFLTLQLLIALTGNYAFFNLLSATLTLFALMETPRDAIPRRWTFAPVRFISFGLITLSCAWSLRPFIGEWPVMDRLLMAASEFRVNSGYGLFAVMTTERLEISIEALFDGQTWQPYHFRFKPNNIDDCGSWVAPHQPRLDWQLWFLSLGTADPNWAARNTWFLRLLDGLGDARPEILALLQDPPLEKPRQLRVRARNFTRGEATCWRATNERELLPAFPPAGLKPFIRR